MEQWISDTFYSYFPSLNAEQTKRENNNRGRQLDYQNYLKKIANSENQTIESKDKDFQNLNNANLTRNADKSEMEIIVTTNPNYENPLKQRENYNQTALRPSSTRDRLLEDLKHTELSNIIYGDAAQRRKQAEAEREIQKKKEYQRDLMRQIEEKRREIELLKEKEKMEDENLTRKLEEQLKTIKLQEELEREKIKTERAKFEIERNKIIREQLISKLEKDKLQVKPPESSSCETKSENEKELHDAFLVDKNKNEVYRFFTNSAQDYRKPLQNHVSTDAFDDFVNSSSANEQILLDSPNFDSFVRNEHTPLLPIDCAHGNRKICPFCEIKLKNYESWCPSCKQQILDDGAENRTMLCENCENQYLICSACDKKKIICEFCHRKRNICASCTRKFCVHCGNSIKPNIKSKLKTSKTDLVNNQMSAVPSEHSFQVLELSNSENHEVPINNSKHSKFSNNLDRAMKFSTNYSTNSIFNPENKSLNSSYFEFGVRNGEIVVNNRIYNNTHKRTLNKNLPNGVKKATADNKTKTKLNIENTSLNEMPLLREVPKKFTLKNKNETKHKLYRDIKSTNSSIDDLSRKWEVPAVEKRTISTNSPIVLTQLGAVRRQLQMERLQAEISN
ncbi:repetitive organellar protein isoform X2 [Condylostylus longicornis]|nr:repetitive organellar protein isoform X2 [Condylostylus longicornis]